MISFDLDFFPAVFPRDEEERFDLTDRIEGFLSSLIRNGNIVGEHVILEQNDRWQVRVVSHSPDALDEANWTQFTRDDMAKLRPLLARDAEFHRVIETEREPTWCDCSSPTRHLLFTHFLDELGSPVSCLDCRRDVPLYHLPVPEGASERAALLSWQDQYQALDTLYMLSGVGERFAYRQLARPKSEFMKQTRELAANLETASQVPTYSFLLHAYKKWGKRCPLCARKWRWKKAPDELFAFKCDHCRLVSSEASSEAIPLSEMHP